jgi:D-sedoheptulose 7-phosphate isomerase
MKQFAASLASAVLPVAPDILKAIEPMHGVATIVTLSGFAADNPLRKLGGANFYVPSSDCGIVETAHLGIVHALLDKVAA